MHPDSSPHAADPREPARLSLVSGGSAEPAPVHPPRAITMGEAIKVYKTTHLSTLRDPASSISRLKHLAPFTERPLDSLTVLELQQFFNQLANDYPAQAHAAAKLLRQIFKRMMELQLYQGFNPAAHVKLRKPKSRAVFIDEPEMARIWKVLECQPADERLYFRMLLTVFCRSGELNTAEVADFAFSTDPETHERRCKWVKAHTKNGRPHTVQLPPQLTEDLWTYLQTRPHKESPILFPGRRNEPRTPISWWYRWDEIRSAAGLEHVHIHDLRRTGASWAVVASGDLNSVSRGGLQHADLTTTSIYVQPMDHKVSEMFVAHERALRAQRAIQQPAASLAPLPHSSPEVSAPVVAPPPEDRSQPMTTRPTRQDGDVMEWPG